MQLSEFPRYFINRNSEIMREDGTFVKQGPYYFYLRGRRLRNWSYKYVRLTQSGQRVQKRVHRLVAKTFVVNPRPDIFDIVDHIDRNKKNNNASNLRWVNTRLNSLNQDRVHNHEERFNALYEYYLSNSDLEEC